MQRFNERSSMKLLLVLMILSFLLILFKRGLTGGYMEFPILGRALSLVELCLRAEPTRGLIMEIGSALILIGTMLLCLMNIVGSLLSRNSIRSVTLTLS